MSQDSSFPFPFHFINLGWRRGFFLLLPPTFCQSQLPVVEATEAEAAAVPSPAGGISFLPPLPRNQWWCRAGGNIDSLKVVENVQMHSTRAILFR